MLAVSNEVPSPSDTTRRIERKFFVPPRYVGLAYALLRQRCHLDAEFPHERITSLYFDTDELDQYTRSVSGEFRKDKVRVRWYPTPGTYNGPVPIFIELKSREGYLSHKHM